MNSEQIIDEIKRMLAIASDFLIEFIPKLILGLIVLLVGYLIARIIQSVISRFINYLDKIINERLKTRVLQVNLANSRTFIGKTFFWIIMFFFVTLFTEIIGLPIITSWLKNLGEHLPDFLAAIVIIFFGIIFSRLCFDLIKATAIKAGISYGSTLAKASQYIILTITIIIAIDQIGINVTFLTNLIYILLGTLLLGAAIAFGLGAQASISNILAAYYVNRNYNEGNVIRIGEHQGRIIKITSTSVYLETDEGQVIIPARDFNEKNTVLIETD